MSDAIVSYLIARYDMLYTFGWVVYSIFIGILIATISIIIIADEIRYDKSTIVRMVIIAFIWTLIGIVTPSPDEMKALVVML